MSVKITQEQPYITTAAVHRPETKNAINFDVMAKLEDLLDELEDDTELRLFILTGSENSFISGGDLHEFHSIEDADGAKKMSERMIGILTRIRQLPCWTLAAVNGITYGGGWETMLSFDFRIAASSATFGFTQGKFYLPPGWGGVTSLAEAVGQNLAAYWLASQKVVNAETALQSGLIQDVFEDDVYQKRLARLKEKLTLNDRPFIEYLKSTKKHKTREDEIEPFSQFWESKEHRKRVQEFFR